MPPCAHAGEVQVLVDPSLEAFSSETGGLYCGSGTAHGILVLTYKQLLDLSGGRVVDVSLDAPQVSGSEGAEQEEALQRDAKNTSETSTWANGPDSEVNCCKQQITDIELGTTSRFAHFTDSHGLKVAYYLSGTLHIRYYARAPLSMASCTGG